MLTGSLQVLCTCCKLNFTILTCIINKIIIFFPVYLQFFQIFARKGDFCIYSWFSVIFGLSIGAVTKGGYVASGRWVSFRLGCCDYSRPSTFFYLFILAKLTCASATALRPWQNAQKIGAIFGHYAQNKCSVKLHRNLSKLCAICIFTFSNFMV